MSALCLNIVCAVFSLSSSNSAPSLFAIIVIVLIFVKVIASKGLMNSHYM